MKIKFNNCGIYTIFNNKSKGFYIGQSRNLKERKRAHWYLLIKNKHYNKRLQNVWNKYGQNAFTFIVLMPCEHYWLNFWEQTFIDIFYDKGKRCYNLSLDVFKQTISEATRRKKSKVSIGEKNHFFGKKHSKESRRKISKARIGYYAGENHPMYGTKRPEKTRKKISEALKGKNNPNFGKKLSMEIRQKISKANKGKYSDEKHPQVRMIIQLDKETGEIIKTWSYIKEAAQELNLQSPNIVACCRGRQKSAGGYKWKYVV